MRIAAIGMARPSSTNTPHTQKPKAQNHPLFSPYSGGHGIVAAASSGQFARAAMLRR